MNNRGRQPALAPWLVVHYWLKCPNAVVPVSLQIHQRAQVYCNLQARTVWTCSHSAIEFPFQFPMLPISISVTITSYENVSLVPELRTKRFHYCSILSLKLQLTSHNWRQIYSEPFQYQPSPDLFRLSSQFITTSCHQVTRGILRVTLLASRALMFCVLVTFKVSQCCNRDKYVYVCAFSFLIL